VAPVVKSNNLIDIQLRHSLYHFRLPPHRFTAFHFGIVVFNIVFSNDLQRSNHIRYKSQGYSQLYLFASPYRFGDMFALDRSGSAIPTTYTAHQMNFVSTLAKNAAM